METQMCASSSTSVVRKSEEDTVKLCTSMGVADCRCARLKILVCEDCCLEAGIDIGKALGNVLHHFKPRYLLILPQRTYTISWYNDRTACKGLLLSVIYCLNSSLGQVDKMLYDQILCYCK